MHTFKTKRTVLFGDCDPGGVIYTPRIAHYVVEAVLEFQASRLDGPAARRIFDMNVLPPARSLSVEFMALLTWDDRIELEVTCTEIGTTSFTCEVTARREDSKVAFIGKLTQVCISPTTKRPVALPEKLRLALRRHDA